MKSKKIAIKGTEDTSRRSALNSNFSVEYFTCEVNSHDV